VEPCRRDNATVIVEPADLGMHGVYVARVIGRVYKNIVQMKFLNISGEDIVLPKNKVLGRVDGMTEDTEERDRSLVAPMSENRKQKAHEGGILETVKLDHLSAEDRVDR
jgi:hypothetical protein